jgi:hypothetical protein
MFTLNYSGSVGFDLAQERRIASRPDCPRARRPDRLACNGRAAFAGLLCGPLDIRGKRSLRLRCRASGRGFGGVVRVGIVLIQINAGRASEGTYDRMAEMHDMPYRWLPVSIAPQNANLEVCVIDKRGIHALVHPVHKRGTDWVDAATKKRIDIEPTHWRKWDENR